MIPPVELARGLKQQSVQTVVIKSTQSHASVFTSWAASQIVLGAGAFALVRNHVDDDLYLVIALGRQARLESVVSSLKKSIGQLPGNPPVHWIRSLTRQLQRLFGWGDVMSTAAEVTRACKSGCTSELLALLPEARALIDQGEVDHLPALHDILRGSDMPALMDCSHKFFEESASWRAPRPCQRCGEARQSALTTCSSCGLICCNLCVRNIMSQIAEQKSLDFAVHEALGKHEWAEIPTTYAFCARCNAEPAFDCPC